MADTNVIALNFADFYKEALVAKIFPSSNIRVGDLPIAYGVQEAKFRQFPEYVTDAFMPKAFAGDRNIEALYAYKLYTDMAGVPQLGHSEEQHMNDAEKKTSEKYLQKFYGKIGLELCEGPSTANTLIETLKNNVKELTQKLHPDLGPRIE